MIFLRKLFSKIQEKPILIVILITLLGLLLRIGNPFYASPILYALSDEASNYMSALYMITQKTLITKAAVYPPLGAYIQIPFLLLAFLISIVNGKFANIPELQFFLVTHEGYFLFVPRLISTVLGTLTIPVVYFIAKELFPKKNRVILLATFFFALAFNHLHSSHFNRPWSGSILFFALAFLYSLRITKKPFRLRNYFIVGLFAGLSYGFHQVGLFSLVLFLSLVFPFSLKGILHTLSQRRILITIIFSCSLFWLFNSLIQNKVTSGFFAPALSNSNANFFLTIFKLLKENVLISLLRQLMVTDPLLIFLGGFSLFNPIFWKYPYSRLSLFTIFYLLIISTFIPGPVRYLLPLLIILSIYSAYTFSCIIRKITWSPLKKVVIYLIALVILLNPVMWNYIFHQEPTFIQLRKYIDNQIKSDIPILFTSYRMTGYLPSLKAIEAVREKHPGYYKQLYTLLQKNNDPFPDNVRNIYYLEQLDIKENLADVVDKYKIQYIVDYYWNPNDKSIISLNNNNFKQIKSFSPLKRNVQEIPLYNITFHIISTEYKNLLFCVERPGPYIDIYKVKN